MKIAKKSLIILLPLFSFFCCASFPAEIEDSNELTFEQKALTSMIINAARGYVGTNTLVARGKRFNSDCTGGIMACYYSAGIDLWEIMAAYSGNGVKRLYYSLKDKNYLHRSPYPVAGDLIFWDNTWDKNGNGKPDDYFTHVGLVVSSDELGNIKYFHHHITLGFVIENMNLLRANVYKEVVDGERIAVNNAIRARGLDKNQGWLASQLCRNFGQAWKVK